MNRSLVTAEYYRLMASVDRELPRFDYEFARLINVVKKMSVDVTPSMVVKKES